jgi:hypothetical protein
MTSPPKSGRLRHTHRSLDVVAKEPGDAPPTTDFKSLLRSLDSNCSYEDMADDPVLKGTLS